MSGRFTHLALINNIKNALLIYIQMRPQPQSPLRRIIFAFCTAVKASNTKTRQEHTGSVGVVSITEFNIP